MPRELYLVTPGPVTLPVIVAACDGMPLGIRALDSGIALQLVAADDGAVLTIENSRQLLAGSDALRVVPSLRQPFIDASHRWWTDATAPWNAAGVVGVSIARRIAEALGGSVTVEEGT